MTMNDRRRMYAPVFETKALDLAATAAEFSRDSELAKIYGEDWVKAQAEDCVKKAESLFAFATRLRSEITD